MKESQEFARKIYLSLRKGDENLKVLSMFGYVCAFLSIEVPPAKNLTFNVNFFAYAMCPL